MKRLLIAIGAGLLVIGADHFMWAVPDADSAAIVSAMEQAVPGFGFRGPAGLRGTISGDSVTVHQHDRFNSAQRRALITVFDSLNVIYGDSIRTFVPQAIDQGE